MNLTNFFAELKRRHVSKVAVAYAVVAWLLIQAASILFPTFEAPGWVMKAFVVLIVLGFPVALILAWAFEMTHAGVKLAENVPPNEKRHYWSRTKFAALIAVIALAAGALLIFQLSRTRSRFIVAGPARQGRFHYIEEHCSAAFRKPERG